VGNPTGLHCRTSPQPPDRRSPPGRPVLTENRPDRSEVAEYRARECFCFWLESRGRTLIDVRPSALGTEELAALFLDVWDPTHPDPAATVFSGASDRIRSAINLRPHGRVEKNTLPLPPRPSLPLSPTNPNPKSAMPASTRHTSKSSGRSPMSNQKPEMITGKSPTRSQTPNSTTFRRSSPKKSNGFRPETGSLDNHNRYQVQDSTGKYRAISKLGPIRPPAPGCSRHGGALSTL